MTVWTKLLTNPVVLDVETTTSNEGNPFDLTNKLILVQIHVCKTGETYVFTDYTDPKIISLLKDASVLVGANLKFDLNWIRKNTGYICTTPVWCVQLAEFMLSYQRWTYPDLDTMAVKYEVGHKIDTIKLNYWDKGIDTDQIPIQELIEYGIEDCKLTRAVFEKQVEKFQAQYSGMFLLFRLHCNDLLVLQEMEYNGLPYDEYSSLKTVDEYEKRVANIDNELNKLFDSDVQLNYGSNDDISIALYGGTKKIETRICVGQTKTGANIGRDRFRILKSTVDFPQLVKPLKGSELKKDGFYSTDSATLLALTPTKKVKTIITLLLERSKCLKVIGTYLKGLPKLREKMNWPPGMLYPSYNQCVASTGRLASARPNAQNQTYESKIFFISRFE